MSSPGHAQAPPSIYGPLVLKKCLWAPLVSALLAVLSTTWFPLHPRGFPLRDNGSGLTLRTG